MKTDAMEMVSRVYEACGEALEKERARREAKERCLVWEQVFRKTHQK
ncbi:hypothetical protein OOT00_16015 [Desulfobotulus sp. H1]|uniref:Uncharacterized protein n=1 Tax=Desulfobotulus pelophilus TaxID=2823377 RepID=A0ABT3NDD3_9BACT|nr:hypothetical protein [Desulfobotulus pelophilus]MCW7755481.1 hypothetical protein [Desulfobotulus pelophilus]